MVSKSVKIGYLEGTGADYVARIVQLANDFSSSVYLEYQSKRVNVKSIMGMMGLGAGEGAEVTICTEGEDEDKAIKAIEDFLAG